MSGVLGQTRVVFQNGQGVGMHILSGHVSFAEDLLEVLVSDGGEVRTGDIMEVLPPATV